MIKIENVEVVGLEAAIRGMRNPMNSWDKSDTTREVYSQQYSYVYDNPVFHIGPNDLELMLKLAKAGSVHAKYRRMIVVYVDITAPLYWWKEFDTYKVGTVANGCSTMHKIADKEFTLEDFSTEHLIGRYDNGLIHDDSPLGQLRSTIGMLNDYRDVYISGGHVDNHDGTMNYYPQKNAKDIWWQMIQLLPSSYNQRRTVMLNYEVLANIYKSRRNHKLDEWSTFCKWIKTLPYSELITGEKTT